MRVARGVVGTFLVGMAACAVAVLIIGSGVSAQASAVRRTPATWKLTRSWKRPSAIGRVVRETNGDGEVEIRRRHRWSAPIPLSVDGEQVSVERVSCASARFCGAVASAYAFALDGGSWIASERIDGAFAGISCPEAGACVTLSTARNGQLVFSAGAWRSLRSRGLEPGSDRVPWQLVCANAASCLAILPSGRTMMFDGHGWAYVPTLDSQYGDLYRGQVLDRVNSVACPATGLCVAVGARDAPVGRFGPYGFYAVFHHGRWSAPIRLPSGPKRKLTVFCGQRLRCVIPLRGRNALASSAWARLPRHAPTLPLPKGLPTLGSVSMTGTEDAPTLTATLHAGSGNVSSLEIATDANEQIFGIASPADDADVTATAGSHAIPVTLETGGDVLIVSFPDPAPTITLTVQPPEISGPGVLGQPARTTETLSFDIENTLATDWERMRRVKLS